MASNKFVLVGDNGFVPAEAERRKIVGVRRTEQSAGIIVWGFWSQHHLHYRTTYFSMNSTARTYIRILIFFSFAFPVAIFSTT